jgi:hypothetical protein
MRPGVGRVHEVGVIRPPGLSEAGDRLNAESWELDLEDGLVIIVDGCWWVGNDGGDLADLADWYCVGWWGVV